MDDDVTTLWDDHFSNAQMAALQDVLLADPALHFIQARTSDGKELLVFRSQHPHGPPPRSSRAHDSSIRALVDDVMKDIEWGAAGFGAVRAASPSGRDRS